MSDLKERERESSSNYNLIPLQVPRSSATAGELVGGRREEQFAQECDVR
jgi:hypothetical protein